MRRCGLQHPAGRINRIYLICYFQKCSRRESDSTTDIHRVFDLLRERQSFTYTFDYKRVKKWTPSSVTLGYGYGIERIPHFGHVHSIFA